MGETGFAMHLHETDIKLAGLSGKLEILIEQNEKFFRWFGRVACFAAFIILVMLAALIWGAVGDKGFNAVRSSVMAERNGH